MPRVAWQLPNASIEKESATFSTRFLTTSRASSSKPEGERASNNSLRKVGTLHRFGVGFVILLGCQTGPSGRANLGKSGPWAVQSGLEIVLVRSFIRLVIWDRFFEPLGCLLSRFRVLLGSFGVILGALGFVFGHSGWHSEVL